MHILLYLGIGLVVGSLSGAMGIGGGILLVPALVWLCHFEPSRATGTSLAILALPIALPAALQAYRKDQVELEPILWIASTFVVGAFVTRSYIHLVPEVTLRLLFGLLMMYIAVRLMLASDVEAASAAAGLLAVAVAWGVFVLLRGLGRRHVVRPELGAEIQRMYRAGRGDPDYHI